MPTAGNSGWCCSVCLLRLLLACFYFKVNVLLFVTAHAVHTAQEGWGDRERGTYSPDKGCSEPGPRCAGADSTAERSDLREPQSRARVGWRDPNRPGVGDGTQPAPPRHLARLCPCFPTMEDIFLTLGPSSEVCKIYE